VTIYLPRSRSAVAPSSQEDTAQYRAIGHQTILIVEDNPEVRNVAVSLFEQLGYRTIAVESSAAALDVLSSRHDVSLVFSDVVLPGHIDGLALAREIAERYPQVPVVLTTGYSKVFDGEPEFPVLRKPYQLSALGRVIRRTLNSSRARRPALTN
jgi:CheY-like chemotaxis protein